MLVFLMLTFTVPNNLYPAPFFFPPLAERNAVAFVSTSWMLYATALHVWETVTSTLVASAPMR